MKRFFVFALFFIAVLAVECAQASTIEILEADKLELRNVTPPGANAPEEYVIISGKTVRLKVDDNELEAKRVEINKTKRKLTIIGQGTFRTKDETINGTDFSFDLDSENLNGQDTIIATKQIDVIGVEVERMPGQLDVKSGYFSPCGRCGRAVNDYAFRAENLTIYPGDRLVAQNVTILIADQPIMFLPVVVVLLNDPNRQPRFQFSEDKTNGKMLEFDLPFFTGTFGIGFTLLRYFELRSPAWGLGFDYSLFAWDAAKATRFFFLALPPENDAAGKPKDTGAILAYRLDTSGQFSLGDELPPFSLQASISRVDSGIQSRDLRGISGANKRTDYDVSLGLENSKFSVKLVANGFWDNRDIEALLAKDPNLTPLKLELGLPTNPLYFPELRVNLASPNLKVGPLSLQNFSFSVGQITAPVDTLNPSAANQVKDKSNFITAGRAVISHRLGFDFEPWSGTNLSASQDFTGRYYTTRNTIRNEAGQEVLGEFERSVDTRISASLSQSLFSSAISLKANYEFALSEGESPFAFDRIARRSPSESLSLSAQVTPFSWLQISANERLDFRKQSFKWDPATFTLSFNPGIVSFGLNATYDFERGEAVRASLNNTSIKIGGFSASASLSYTYAATIDKQKDSRIIRRFDSDLSISFGYQDPGGKFSASITLNDDINIGQIRNWSLSSNLNIGTRESPINFSLNQTLSPPQYTVFNQSTTPAKYEPIPDIKQASYKLNGSFSVSLLGLRLTLGNNFDFKQVEIPVTDLINKPLSNFSVSLENLASQDISWNVRYAGSLDFEPFTVFDPTYSASFSIPLGISSLRASLTYQALRQNPSLSGSLEFSLPTIDVTLSNSFAAPSKTQPEFELRQANLRLGLDVLPGFSIQGSINYLRTTSSNAGQFIYNDAFTFSPFGATLALGKEKPEVFITVLLKGTYNYASNNAGKPTYNGAFSSLRPIIVFTFDRCCYALQLTFDTTDPRGASFKFAFLLPGGASQSIIEADDKSIRFPAVPFLPPIPLPAR